jgi:hypothetical protein
MQDEEGDYWIVGDDPEKDIVTLDVTALDEVSGGVTRDLIAGAFAHDVIAGMSAAIGMVFVDCQDIMTKIEP